MLNPIEKAACPLLAYAITRKAQGVSPIPLNPMIFSPLLEQEGHGSGLALVAQAARPIRVHRAGAGAAFAADDDPIERQRRGTFGVWTVNVPFPDERHPAFHIAPTQGIDMDTRAGRSLDPRHYADACQIDVTQQRLHRQEADACVDRQQLGNVPICLFLIDDGDAQPDVRVELRKVEWHRQHVRHVADPLRQQQPVEVRRLLDQEEEVRTPLRIDRVVEHVGKAGAEHPLAPPMLGHEGLSLSVPFEWLAPVRCAGPPARCARAPVDRRAVVAGVARFGIAMVAAGAYLLATFPWVKGVIAPFD